MRPLAFVFRKARKWWRGFVAVIAQKGNGSLNNVNMTGTDLDSPDKLKFGLKPLWEVGLLPTLDALVGPDGQCDGVIFVIQEDNTGIPTSFPNAYPNPILDRWPS
jgi:hypothetical protein